MKITKRLLVAGCLLLSAEGFSQSMMQNIGKRLEFGLKAGVNYSGFTDAGFPSDPLPGFHAGATVGFKIAGNLLFQEEFLFSSEGAKDKSTLFDGENIRLYYVSVPFLLKYRGRSGLYIEAGPQVGIKANEKVEGISAGAFAKKLDLAVAGGIGFQSKIGLGIGARYIYGLSTVGDFTISNTSNNFKNRNAQVSVFYVF